MKPIIGYAILGLVIVGVAVSGWVIGGDTKTKTVTKTRVVKVSTARFTGPLSLARFFNTSGAVVPCPASFKNSQCVLIQSRSFWNLLVVPQTRPAA